MTISECIDDYINKNKEYLKERTIYSYNNKKLELLRTFGDVDIDAFTQEFLQNYINECQKQGTPKKTLQTRLALLFLALKPYKKYQPFRFVVVEKDKEEKKVYSENEVKQIADYIVAHPRRLYTPILIAIYTGMRLSEITGLKWEDVDFAEKTISIKRNATIVAGKEFVSTPKTKNGIRTVYMTDTLCEYLKPLKRAKDFYVCTGSAEIQPARSVQRSNELLCKKLGIKNCGMHAYRHAFASALLKESTDFKTISEVMGHSNILITQNIYNHTTQARKNEVVAKAFGEKPTSNEQAPVEIQAQINNLQAQVNNLCAMIGKMAQYIQDNTVQKKSRKRTEPTTDWYEPKLPPITAQKKPNIQQLHDRENDTRPPKYKVTDGYGNDKLFYSDMELLEDLDISKKELQQHLNGQYTVLDDLEIMVVRI